MITATELIEILKKLPPETPIAVYKDNVGNVDLGEGRLATAKRVTVKSRNSYSGDVGNVEKWDTKFKRDEPLENLQEIYIL